MAGPVLIIGASHTQGTNGDLTGSASDNYAPHGYWTGRLPAGSMVYGVSGYTMENMMDLWLVPNFVTPNVNVPATVVILLGHNNNTNGSSTPATPGGTSEINYLVDLLRGRGATRILAITCTATTVANSISYDFYDDNFVTWNSQQVANSLVKGYEIIDYKLAFYGTEPGPVDHPEYFIADGLHHTEAGKQAYVDLVVAAINATAPTNSWIGTKALSGSQVVTPSATTSYTLTATNAAGSVSDTKTITVSTGITPDYQTTFASAEQSMRWDVGGGGWGNSEIQSYTNRVSPTSNFNISYNNPGLNIIARYETYTGSDGITRNYTSSRLFFRDWWEAYFITLEVYAKVPYIAGGGITPAVWLNCHHPSGTYPTWQQYMGECGFEFPAWGGIGNNTSVNCYWIDRNGAHSNLETVAGGFNNDYHYYRVVKSATQIRWYIDNSLVLDTGTLSSQVQTDLVTQMFYPTINTAVGGGLPGGSPSGGTGFPNILDVRSLKIWLSAVTP